MKNQELPRHSLMDMIVKHSVPKSTTPNRQAEPAPEEPGKGPFYWIAYAMGFFALSTVLYLAYRSISNKFGFPSFSYVEVSEIYLAWMIIVRSTRK